MSFIRKIALCAEARCAPIQSSPSKFSERTAPVSKKQEADGSKRPRWEAREIVAFEVSRETRNAEPKTARRSARYSPPFTSITAPLTKLAASEAKNNAIHATSSGLPGLPSAIFFNASVESS